LVALVAVVAVVAVFAAIDVLHSNPVALSHCKALPAAKQVGIGSAEGVVAVSAPRTVFAA
jgi:hypothetical protein